jgi:uncharacterized membrane protein YeiH
MPDWLSRLLSGLEPAPGLLGLLLPALDLAAAAVFAVTGALVASRKQMDVVGFMWLGVVTGIGGGTCRDLLLGLPVFWVQDSTPVVACLLTAAAVYCMAHLVQSRYRLILWLDAVGLALVTIAGTAKGLNTGAGPVVAVVMGVVTAALGGIIRDVLGHEPSIVLRREIYVTASLIGSVTYVVLTGLEIERTSAMLVGGVAAFVVRGLALAFGWSLPTYRARPGRPIADMEAAHTRDAPLT